MNENSNKYAMAALKKKRAGISSEIIHLERQLRFRRDSLVHLDATVRLLDPDADPEKIPNARRRVHLFKQGELGRAIVDTLRRAEKPLPAQEIVSGVMAICGQEEPARPTMLRRVRANLRAEIKRRNLNYEQLAEKLAEMGVHDTAKNISNKIARGAFTAGFFVMCLEVIGAQTVRLAD